MLRRGETVRRDRNVVSGEAAHDSARSSDMAGSEGGCQANGTASGVSTHTGLPTSMYVKS